MKISKIKSWEIWLLAHFGCILAHCATADKHSIHKWNAALRHFFLKEVNNERKLIHYSWLLRKCSVFQPLIARKMPAHAYLLAYCGRCTRAWRNGLWFVRRFPGSDLAPPPPGNGAFEHIAENVLVWRGTKALDKLVSNGLKEKLYFFYKKSICCT